MTSDLPTSEFIIAAAPTEPVALPPAVRDLAAGRALVPVWKNEPGGITWSAGDRHIKWNPHSTGIDLADEVVRLDWASERLPCPRVLDHGADADGQWIVTETIAGRTAISAVPNEVDAAVEAIADGQRRVHSLPIDDCPFEWSLARRHQRALERLARGVVDPAAMHPQHRGLSTEDMRAMLSDVPDLDPVVCHGDPCAPNTLIGPTARFVGLVDLGSLGVGDRWADASVAAWSLDWNFGPGWIDRFLDAYGLDRDDDRLAWHQLLWDLG